MYTIITKNPNDFWKILETDVQAIMVAVYNNNNFSHYKIITKKQKR